MVEGILCNCRYRCLCEISYFHPGDLPFKFFNNCQPGLFKLLQEMPHSSCQVGKEDQKGAECVNEVFVFTSVVSS